MKKRWSFALIATAAFALGVNGVTCAWAQDGVIAFLDLCNVESRAYVMRGQAESASNPRVLLSMDQFRAPLDISTTGPVTVLLQGSFAVGPLAVQVNEDAFGNLVPEAPVSIRLPDDPNLPPNVNTSSFERFSPLGDRVAIVTSGGFLVIADIVRDVNDKISGVTNPTVVANLLTIGSPSDSNLSSGPPANYPDFSPDGTQIVVTIHYDLWLLDLESDGHTLASAQPLTRTFRDTEWQAVFSPDGSTIAFVGAANKGGAGPDSRHPLLYTLDLDTREVIQVTPSGAVVGLRDPAWSPDGQILAFSAVGPRARGPAETCRIGNYDIFSINADGTGTPALLTTTVGTGVEMRTQWGW